MESVGGAVRANESFAVFHRVEQGLLAGLGHRWLAVGPRLTKISGRVKEEGVKLRQIVWRKQRSVFGECELPIVLRPHFHERLFHKAWLALLIRDDAVFEGARLGEKENLLRTTRLACCER